jgi:hypothetical protein
MPRLFMPLRHLLVRDRVLGCVMRPNVNINQAIGWLTSTLKRPNMTANIPKRTNARTGHPEEEHG